jgi:hypothetical protein
MIKFFNFESLNLEKKSINALELEYKDRKGIGKRPVKHALFIIIPLFFSTMCGKTIAVIFATLVILQLMKSDTNLLD